VFLYETSAGLLGGSHLEPLYRCDNLIRFVLKRAVEQRNTMLGVKSVGVYKVVRDGRGGFAKHVGNDSIKGYVADGKDILIAVLLAGFAGDQLEAIPRILAKDADILVGDKTAGYQSKPEQVADPFGILNVVFATLNCFDPLWVRNSHIDGIFKQVEHGNPIFPGRFHADVPAVVLQQPRLEIEYLFVERRKSPLLVRWLYSIRGDERRDKKGFVDIHTATGWVYDSQMSPLLRQIGEGKALTEPPHI